METSPRRVLNATDRVTDEQQKWEARLRERLIEETDPRVSLLLRLELEMLLVQSQLKEINCQNNYHPWNKALRIS
jgi:hypothetical protein